MKLKIFLIGLLAIIISLFTVNNKVNASVPDSFTVDSLGSIRTLDYFSDNFDDGIWVHKKKASTGDFIYCIEIEKSSGDSVYKLKGEMPAKFAYILENGYAKKSIFGNANKDYFTTAIAIWYFSKPYSNATTYNNIFDDFDFTNGTYKGVSSDVVKAAANLINGANSYSYVTPAIRLNNSNNNLTLSSDGKYYVSSNLSVTTTGNVGEYTVSLNNAPEGTIVTDVNGKTKNTFAKSESFIVKVPASSINKLSYEFSVSVSATGTINKAYKYAPDDSSYQAVVALYPETSNVRDTTTLKLNLTTEVQISKTDATTSEEVAGAHLVVQDSTGKVVDEWISGNEAHVIKGLEPGKYTLKETIAPDGYILSEEVITFEIKADGTVTKVEMKNYPEDNKTVLISKQDATTSEEIPGAYLELYDEDGNLVEAWISTDEVHAIIGLKPGKYTLKETIAPEGYELSSETVSFVVKEDGTVDGMVIMYNKPEEVEVPSTSSFRTITASLMGIIIIGLGAMIIYKNYKKNEEN